MKKLLTAAVLTLAMALPFAASAAEKIAVVDMGKVMQKIPQRAEISKKLNSEFSDRIAELKQLEEQLQKLQEDGQRNSELMTDEQKRKSQRKAESLEAQYKLKVKAFRQDSQQRQQEEERKLLSTIQKTVSDIAKKDGFDMVLTGQAALYAEPSSDISDKVISSLSNSGK